MASAPRAPWRRLLTPAWIAGHLLAIAVVVSFSNFGAWQMRRHEQRVEQNAFIEARLAEAPVGLEAALAKAEAERRGSAVWADGDALAYRRVRVTGRYDPAHEVLRRPVARDGVPGFHVVTPLVLADGSAVLVERGWVPQEHDRVPLEAAPPPQGEVTIDAWAFAGDRPPTGAWAALAPRDPPDVVLTQVAYVDPVRLAEQMPYPLQPLRLVLEAGPRPPGDRQLPLPPLAPEMTLGPHLGYAIQWYGFVAVTVIGYAALMRRRYREAATGADGTINPVNGPSRRP